MKKIIIILFILVLMLTGCAFDRDSISGSGQLTTTSYEFDEFTKIETDSNFEVVIKPSDSYAIEITCDDNIVEYLDVKKVGSTLSLSLKGFNSYRDIDLRAKVSMPDITKIEGSGSSDITIEEGFSLSHDLEIVLSGASSLNGTFESDDLEARLLGASDISGNVKINNLMLDLSGASKATFEGSAGNLECKLEGSSDADLYDLPVKDADVQLAGASKAKITVDGDISLDASGASTLFYKGNGTIESIELSGESKIEKTD